MNTDVDLSQLAIDRGDAAGTGTRFRRPWLTRYLLPGVLLSGFAAVIAWASWDYVFPPRPVKVVPVLATHAEVRQEGTPLFKAAGWVEPRPTPIRVATLAPGVVEKLLVREDDPVTEGQKIAYLVKEDAILARNRALADEKLRVAELEQANAELTAAKTRHKQPVHLEAPLREAETALAKVETQLANLPFETKRAEARLAVAKEDLKGKLAAKGVFKGIAIKQAEQERDTAEALVKELLSRAGSLQNEKQRLLARCKALRTQLELLAEEKKAVAEAEAKVKAAKARLEQAGVAVDEAELRLKRMTITAPVAGRVYQLIAHPGARVGSGMMTQMKGHDGSTVVTMYRPDRLQVRVDVRFNDLPKIQTPQKVRIENPALEEPLTGTVLFVSSIADIQKNTLEVKVAIDDPPSVFKPDMLVDVTFLAPKPPERSESSEDELRLYLPRQLVQQEEGGAFVWVADQAAGIARRTQVELGPTTANGLVEITKGLTVGSRVISDGSDGLQDGDRIRITGEEPAVAMAGPNTKKNRSSSLKRIHSGGDK